jgi:hypothetical protein
MASKAEIAPGIHLVKMRQYGSQMLLTVPKALALPEGFKNGFFLGVMVQGECVVLAPVTDATCEGAQQEMRKAFKTAVKSFEKQQ